MPIMRVQNIGHNAEELAGADDGAAEKREALDAVVVAVSARRIDLLAIEEMVVRDKVERDIRVRKCRAQERSFGGPVRPHYLRRREHFFERGTVSREPLARLPVQR